jgi:hypothetical protein
MRSPRTIPTPRRPVADRLAGLPQLDGISPARRAELEGHADAVRVDAGAVLEREGTCSLPGADSVPGAVRAA